MNWFNWVGVIVYIVIFISYIATSEMSDVANERTGGGLFGKENILTALSLIFSVFQIVPFCLNMELRDDRWGGWFIAYVSRWGSLPCFMHFSVPSTRNTADRFLQELPSYASMSQFLRTRFCI